MTERTSCCRELFSEVSVRRPTFFSGFLGICVMDGVSVLVAGGVELWRGVFSAASPPVTALTGRSVCVVFGCSFVFSTTVSRWSLHFLVPCWYNCLHSDCCQQVSWAWLVCLPLLWWVAFLPSSNLHSHRFYLPSVWQDSCFNCVCGRFILCLDFGFCEQLELHCPDFFPSMVTCSRIL